VKLKLVCADNFGKVAVDPVDVKLRGSFHDQSVAGHADRYETDKPGHYGLDRKLAGF